jgi:hypothetical protein
MSSAFADRKRRLSRDLFCISSNLFCIVFRNLISSFCSSEIISFLSLSPKTFLIRLIRTSKELTKNSNRNLFGGVLQYRGEMLSNVPGSAPAKLIALPLSKKPFLRRNRYATLRLSTCWRCRGRAISTCHLTACSAVCKKNIESAVMWVT